MQAENSPDEDPSHALKRLLVKNAKNQQKFFEDWRAFTEKNGHTPLFVPFIDEDTIKLLNFYIQSVKQTLDEVADQIFEIFRRLANPVMDRVTLQENLSLKESAKPLLGLVMLLKDICNSSDFYAKRYITSGSLEWTLSSLVLNDAILPICKSAIIDSLEFMCKCSEEISVMLIHSHGPRLAYAVFSSPCVSVRFRLIHLLRSLFTQAASRLLMEKGQEWFPQNYKLFVDISTLADVLNFAYSAENSQVTSYVCRQVSALHLDRNHFLTPPVGFKKMWMDFDSKMKYLGFFFKPIMRKGVKESTDLNAVFYIIISEAIVERAEVELLKRSNDLQDLQLILYLRKELKELTNAPIYPIRHSRILFIAVEYDVHLLEIIQTIFSNVKIVR